MGDTKVFQCSKYPVLVTADKINIHTRAKTKIPCLLIEIEIYFLNKI